MKSWKVLVAAAVVGTSVGVGMTVVEMVRSSESFFLADRAVLPVEESIPAHKQEDVDLSPNVKVIGGRVHDFGTMDRSTTKFYTFLIKNVGKGSLNLSVKRTTCKCTTGQIEGSTYEPGEIAELEVEWTGETPGSDPEFEQTVEVNTNDPQEKLLILKIRGRVTETIRVLPDELSIGRVSSNEGTEAEFRLFGFRSDRIKIHETAFENPDTAQFFDISFEPLPQSEVELESDASCGLLAKVSVKPGLPLGPVEQTIRIGAEVDKEVVVHVPLKGRAVGDVIVSGLKYLSVRNLLVLGVLKRSESTKAVLNVFVTGKHRHDTHLSVGEVEPLNCYRIDIGPPEELSSGTSIKYVVTIEIPAGLQPINRRGSTEAKFGRIILETTHPRTRQIPIDVKFSIE